MFDFTPIRPFGGTAFCRGGGDGRGDAAAREKPPAAFASLFAIFQLKYSAFAPAKA
ncbi:hypothetical protein [Chromobacterium subtsugae]|uniref:hypothetical protein n=1 Tax=Chromobacterium subtsugae TaxID=251747 RepID=UPI000A960698|nr:hypothetical protein [Chromobacterium subtsugae]